MGDEKQEDPFKDRNKAPTLTPEGEQPETAETPSSNREGGEDDPRSPVEGKQTPGLRGTSGSNANFDPQGKRASRNREIVEGEEYDPHGGEEEQAEGTEPDPIPGKDQE